MKKKKILSLGKLEGMMLKFLNQQNKKKVRLMKEQIL